MSLLNRRPQTVMQHGLRALLCVRAVRCGVSRIRIIAVVTLTCAGLVCLLVGFGALLVPAAVPSGPCGTVWVPVDPAPAGCGQLLGSLAGVTLVLIPASVGLLVMSSWWSAKLLERFLPWPPG